MMLSVNGHVASVPCSLGTICCEKIIRYGQRYRPPITQLQWDSTQLNSLRTPFTKTGDNFGKGASGIERF